MRNDVVDAARGVVKGSHVTAEHADQAECAGLAVVYIDQQGLMVIKVMTPAVV